MNIKFPQPGFENIEIKCKTGNKEDKKNTEFLINELSLVYEYAANFSQGQGMEAMAKEFKQKADILFAILEDLDHYDKYKSF